MSQFDRLSSLMSRFKLQVTPCIWSDGQLFVTANRTNDDPQRVLLSPSGNSNFVLHPTEKPMFSAQVDWSGSNNPMFQALPGTLELDLASDPQTASLVQLLKFENDAQRCGSESVLNRLGEVLMVRLMRLQIERGDAKVGLFGGLSDPRLSRAIVAIHENPGKHWRNQDLADVAGLSLSRFAELFQSIVGETPIGYLRRWRLILARQDIGGGSRIQETARRYGYRSSEALSRAFSRQFGETPIEVRKHHT
ncbi:MAG: AraC family transcriptional regulator [Hyphomicrobiales bacterium]